MGGGGKGGSQNTEVKIPPALELYAKDVMNMSMTAAQQPFIPNQGMEVAAMSPMQVAAMQGANNAAQAYGQHYVPDSIVNQSMPDVNRNEMGIAGHSSIPLYRDALDRSYTPEFRQQRRKLYTGTLGNKRNPNLSAMYDARYGGTNFNKRLPVGPDPREGGGK